MFPHMIWTPLFVYMRYLDLIGSMFASASLSVLGISSLSFSKSSVSTGGSLSVIVLLGGVMSVGVVLVVEREFVGFAAKFAVLVVVFGMAVDAAARFAAKTTSKNTAKAAVEIFMFLFIFSPAVGMLCGLF